MNIDNATINQSTRRRRSYKYRTVSPTLCRLLALSGCEVKDMRKNTVL